jgi:hypothetical protein
MDTTYIPRTQLHRLWVRHFLGLDLEADYGNSEPGSLNHLIKKITSDTNRQIQSDNDSSCTSLLQCIKHHLPAGFARELRCYHAVGTVLQISHRVDAVLFIPLMYTSIGICLLPESKCKEAIARSERSQKRHSDQIYYISYPDSYDDISQDVINEHGNRIARKFMATFRARKAAKKARDRDIFGDRPKVEHRRRAGKPTYQDFFPDNDGRKPCNKDKHRWGDKKMRGKLSRIQKKEKKRRKRITEEYKKHPNPHQQDNT